MASGIKADKTKYDAVVIGGGFFGCRIAVHLTEHFDSVLLLERDDALLKRASYSNQARVHGGYHYPRSLLTALRSRLNLDVFKNEYEDAIDTSFTKLYAISRQLSKVTAAQFYEFSRRIKAPIRAAPAGTQQLFNENLIEDVFEVEEYAFDASLLRDKLLKQLAAAKVTVKTGAEVTKLEQLEGGELRVDFTKGEKEFRIKANAVFNCTYSQINTINQRANVPLIPLKHELAEIALVDVPKELENIGITVMCGPFFSIMPFPAAKAHSLSHVRYTPHTEWYDDEADAADRHGLYHTPPKTAFARMVADARRYVPAIGDVRHRESLFEVKTVLPKSEGDDSRPILYLHNYVMNGYTCIMGGKIDNVYDVLRELDLEYGKK